MPNNDSQYNRLFSALPPVEPSFDFDKRICDYIKLKKEKKIKINIFGFCAIALSSSLATVYTGSIFIRSFFDSGSSEYLSLILSMDASFMVFWKEILLSLVESIPLSALALSLTAIVLFIWSIAKVTNGAGRLSSSISHA